MVRGDRKPLGDDNVPRRIRLELRYSLWHPVVPQGLSLAQRGPYRVHGTVALGLEAVPRQNDFDPVDALLARHLSRCLCRRDTHHRPEEGRHHDHFMILWATLNSTIAKYLINCYDLRSEVPWEGKSMYVFFVDLVTDFLKLATYLGFCALIVSYYGLPLNIIRDVYITGRSFFGRIRDFIKYRAATRNMDTRFPDATQQDMRTMSDGTCIICREEMIVSDAGATDENEGRAPGPSPPTSSGLNETPKKLPCGHIFHFHCLRSWLERQQSCPTCRRTVFDAPAAATPAAPAGGEAGPAQGAGAPGQGPARGAEAANPAQTARDRLQGFLQQLQTDAQRAREQGDRSAREAAAAANAAAASGSFSRSATPRPGPSTVTDNTRTRNAAGALPTASATAAEVPPRSHTTSRTQSPNRSSQRPRGRTPIRRALINSLFHTSGASSPHHQNMFGTGDPSTSPPAHYQNMYGVGPSLNSTFARGSDTHIGPSWIPPPPWTFRPSVTAGPAKKGEGGTATAADAKEKASTEQDGGEPKEAKDAPIDPLDAREAARAAALKRFEALGKGTASKAASSSRSVTMPPSSAQPSDRPAETARQEEAPSEEADIPGNPALIPLFDPLTIPSFSADSLPLPLASGPASTQSTVQQGTQPHLDARLSDAELATLSRSTRQGLEERLKLLERVQGSIWLAVEELSRALSVVPDDEASERINDNEGDEHQRGRTTRRVEEEEHVGLSKGKEKQREEEEVDN
ncbi:hypothetical protein L7F22_066837 [Adiantum nelumboides]|nr:hypothetical protein [Adiantum nelumboides]